MNGFVKHILPYGNLSKHEIDCILKKAFEVELPKDYYFSEVGKVARQFGFITEGVIRVCRPNNEGEEVTKYFIEENNIVVDLNSFNKQLPSVVYLQAITDCKMIVFSKEDWEELLTTISCLENSVNKIISKAMFQKVVRLSDLVSEDGTTKYLNFLEKYPNLVNRIPLSYIASYLGITQSSLSRIRKSIT
jgi:CRP-like cAMP-binding protein